jgi:hypothetical protein
MHSMCCFIDYAEIIGWQAEGTLLVQEQNGQSTDTTSFQEVNGHQYNNIATNTNQMW